MAEPATVGEDLPTILDRVQAWITSVDQKLGVIAAIQTIACGFLFPELSEWVQKPTTSAGVKVALVAGAVVLAMGLGFALYALFPITTTTNKRKKTSVTFFGSIVEFDSNNEYGERLEKMSKEAWRAEYLSQIRICSQIATTKYDRVKVSILVFVGGLGIVSACYLAALGGL